MGVHHFSSAQAIQACMHQSQPQASSLFCCRVPDKPGRVLGGAQVLFGREWRAHQPGPAHPPGRLSAPACQRCRRPGGLTGGSLGGTPGGMPPAASGPSWTAPGAAGRLPTHPFCGTSARCPAGAGGADRLGSLSEALSVNQYSTARMLLSQRSCKAALQEVWGRLNAPHQPFAAFHSMQQVPAAVGRYGCQPSGRRLHC